MRLVVTLLLSLCLLASAPSESEPAETENVLRERSVLVVPPDYDPKRKYPLLIALPFTHGTAASLMRRYLGRWQDEKSLQQRLAQKTRELVGEKREFFLMMTPGTGSPSDHTWQGFTRAIERYERRIDNDVREYGKKYSIDTDRLVLIGFSLGGDLAWALANKNAGRFRGAIVAGSRCSYSKDGSLARLKEAGSRFVLAMGDHESAVRVKGAKSAKERLDSAGIENIYFVIPNAGHDALPPEKFAEALTFVMFD